MFWNQFCQNILFILKHYFFHKVIVKSEVKPCEPSQFLFLRVDEFLGHLCMDLDLLFRRNLFLLLIQSFLEIKVNIFIIIHIWWKLHFLKVLPLNRIKFSNVSRVFEWFKMTFFRIKGFIIIDFCLVPDSEFRIRTIINIMLLGRILLVN